MAKETGKVEETGYSRVVVQRSGRNRYRGFVRLDDDKTIMQTSTSYVREEDAVIAMHDAFEIMKRDPLLNLELDQEGRDQLTKEELSFWERAVRRYNGQ